MLRRNWSLRYPPLASFALFALFAATAPTAALSGCDRNASADVAIEPIAAVPRDVIFHVHVLYGGDDAYLVDGKWYCPGTGGWLVFTKEPLELEMIRHSFDESHASAIRFGM